MTKEGGGTELSGGAEKEPDLCVSNNDLPSVSTASFKAWNPSFIRSPMSRSLSMSEETLSLKAVGMQNNHESIHRKGDTLFSILVLES